MTVRTGHVAAGAGILLVVLVGWLSTAPPERAADTALDLLSVLVPAVAAVFAGRAARAAQGRARRGWVVLTAGLVSATMGEAIWAHRDLFGRVLTAPSPADAAYLAFLVSVPVAVLLFGAGDDRYQSRARVVLDGVVVATSMFVVSWVAVIRDLVSGDTPAWPSLLTALAYPILNLIALTVATIALVRSGSAQRLTLGLLTAGLFTMTLAESLFVYLVVDAPFSGHHVVELSWLTGMLLILLAAVAGGRDGFGNPPPAAPGWASVWLPYAPFMLAVVFLAPQPRTVVLGIPVVVAAVILVPAVLIRQFLAVSEGRRLVTTVAEQALHDPLTGLANRSLIIDRLDEMVAASRRDGSTVGVLLLDLDDFKLVNDRHGHSGGDEVLTVAADRLRTAAGPGSVVARLGGDEFVIALNAPAETIHGTVARVAAAFSDPIPVGNQRVHLVPTIGLATAEAGGLPAAELIKGADSRMYAQKRAKADVARRSAVGTATTAPDDIDGPPRLLADLRKAVDDGDLTLVYRPQADLRTGQVVGVEALLRWPHPELGLLSPDQFLPLVRDHGMIDPVTEFVVHRALADARDWRSGGVGIGIAVNLFAPCVRDPGLPERIARMLSRSGVSPDRLTLEITEDLPIGAHGAVLPVLTALRDTGVRISVDDFGSGYSTLSDLYRLPIDEIKIDDDFVGSLHTDPKADAVVRSLAALAGELGLIVVAEGVRESWIARLLLDYGCHVGQGDHFGRPMTAGDLAAHLRDTRPAAAGTQPGVGR